MRAPGQKGKTIQPESTSPESPQFEHLLSLLRKEPRTRSKEDQKHLMHCLKDYLQSFLFQSAPSKVDPLREIPGLLGDKKENAVYQKGTQPAKSKYTE